jgi:hypothetical protein
VDSVQRWKHAPARLRVGYHPIALRFVGEGDEVSIGPTRQKVLILVSGIAQLYDCTVLTLATYDFKHRRVLCNNYNIVSSDAYVGLVGSS